MLIVEEYFCKFDNVFGLRNTVDLIETFSDPERKNFIIDN